MNFFSRNKANVPILIALFFLPHFIFVWASHSIWPWDQAWYGEETFRAWNTLIHYPADYLNVLLHQFAVKAPLIAWIGQWFAGLAYVTGEPHAILLSVPLAGAAATYLLWKAFQSDQRAAAVAIAFTVSMPLFFGLQREYVVETLQFLSVSTLVFLYYQRKRFEFWPLFFFTLFGVALGLCAKVSTPLYQVFWGLFITGELWLKAKHKNWGHFFQLRHILIFTFFLLVLSWYLINLKQITQFLREASSGNVAALYGSASPFWVKFRFWGGYFWDGIAGGRTLIVSQILLLFLFFFNLRKNRSLAWVIVALQVLFPLFVFSFQINEETRYLLPIFPTVIAGVFEICKQRPLDRKLHWVPLAFSLICLFRFFELNAVSLHQLSNATRTPWVSYFQDRAHDRETILSVIDRTCTTEGEQSIVGVERPDMNNVTLNFYLNTRPGKAELNCAYHSLGYAAESVDVSLNYISQFHFRNFITYDSSTLDKWKDAFNLTSANVADRIRSDSRFSESVEFAPIHLFILK